MTDSTRENGTTAVDGERRLIDTVCPSADPVERIAHEYVRRLYEDDNRYVKVHMVAKTIDRSFQLVLLTARDLVQEGCPQGKARTDAERGGYRIAGLGRGVG